jgi:hypothetical protein
MFIFHDLACLAIESVDLVKEAPAAVDGIVARYFFRT